MDWWIVGIAGALLLLIMLKLKKNRFFKGIGHFVVKVIFFAAIIYLMVILLGNDGLRESISSTGFSVLDSVKEKIARP